MVRVPMYKPNKGQSTRIELRTIDSACNPYLAFAVILAAGLKGIEEGYELPREAEDDVWSLNERERKCARHRRRCPRASTRRSRSTEDTELLAETLGEHVYDFFLRNKRAEWEDYRGQVSAFERDLMLPVLRPCCRRASRRSDRSRAALPSWSSSTRPPARRAGSASG